MAASVTVKRFTDLNSFPFMPAAYRFAKAPVVCTPADPPLFISSPDWDGASHGTRRWVRVGDECAVDVPCSWRWTRRRVARASTTQSDEQGSNLSETIACWAKRSKTRRVIGWNQ
jgi:hypothetical protein